MTLVEAKYTNCGANLKVDQSLDAANCDFCGSAFIVDKAIHNYNIENKIAHAQINAGTVNVSVGGTNPTEQSLLDYAKRVIENNPKEAIQTYKGVLKANPDCFRAWLGIAEANVVLTEKGAREAAFGVWIYEYGKITTIPQYYNEFESALENARRCVPAAEKNVVEQFFDVNVTQAKLKADEYLRKQLLDKKAKDNAQFSTFAIFGVFFVIGLIVAGVGLFAFGRWEAAVIGIIICVISGFLIKTLFD